METNHRESSGRPGAGTDKEDGSFRRRMTIEEIAAEQGVPLIADFNAMLADGKAIWDSDEEKEAWLKNLQEARREGR